MPFDAQSGERLRSERERLGLTQQAMADAAGVRREMWSKYERGVAVPGGDVFEALAGLRVDLMFVLTGDYLSVAQAKAVLASNAATSRNLTGSSSSAQEVTIQSNRQTSAGLTADELELLELFRAASLAQKMEAVAVLSAKPKTPTKGPGIKVSGRGHRVAGRDLNVQKE